MSKHGFIPLAKVGKGETLCASAAQDQYHVVQTSGKSRKVSLQEAVQLYLKAASDEDKLVWKRKFKRSPKDMETIAAEEESSEMWVKKLRRTLGISEEPDQPGD
jgi:hypothetical protein